MFYDYPLTVEGETGSRARLLPVSAPPPRHMWLYSGMGIRNATQPATTAGRYASGTLGCFVRARAEGALGILTAAHAIAGDDLPEVGEVVAVGGRKRGNYPFARISQIHWPRASAPRASISSGNVDLNQFEGVVATLDAGCKIDHRPGGARFKMPRWVAPSSSGDPPGLGDQVYKIGAGSGLTRGVIAQVSVSTPLAGPEGLYWFSGLFQVQASALGNEFTAAGDSGALVVRERDNVPLGMVFAGVGHRTLVIPRLPLLDALGCELVVT